MSYSTTVAARNAAESDVEIGDQTERLSKREHSVSHAAISERTQTETQTYGRRLAAHKLLQLLKPQRGTRNLAKPEMRRIASDAQLAKTQRTGGTRPLAGQMRVQPQKELQKTTRLSMERKVLGLPVNFVQRNILKVSRSQQKL